MLDKNNELAKLNNLIDELSEEYSASVIYVIDPETGVYECEVPDISGNADRPYNEKTIFKLPAFSHLQLNGDIKLRDGFDDPTFEVLAIESLEDTVNLLQKMIHKCKKRYEEKYD